MGVVLRTGLAERDLEQILEYIDERNPKASQKLAREIDRTCAVLADFPEIGRLREELAPGLRSFHVGKYLILYRPSDEGIEVIRFVHGSRDLPSLFQ
jgi:toxin ParE1/3/4